MTCMKLLVWRCICAVAIALPILACVTLCDVVATDDVIVSLKQGQQLRGLKVSNSSYGVIYKFLGIPYAKPPLGDRRYAPPEAADEWPGIRNATTRSDICLQINKEDYTSSRSEDCLFLNVFSTDLNASMPVLVWIHGGAFGFGSGYHDGDGATLAPLGVVVVTINYRLGPLGFASTGDDVMPGNYGMLDQVLALKWVQNNVQVFGGNPNAVTIGGESAGAHSVSLLILSPLTKGLFIRAIMESGSSLCPSAVERPARIVKLEDYTNALAVKMGCNTTDSTAILQCLRYVDANALILASEAARNELGAGFIFAPRVEATFGFLPDDPFNLLQNGLFNRVDTLRGTNSGEWCWAVQDPENDGISRQEFLDYFQMFFQVRGSLHNEQEVTRLVAEAYMGNETDPIALRTNLVHVMADINFGAGAVVEVNKVVSFSSADSTSHYLYGFDQRASGTETPDWCGVEHAKERPFVFFDRSNESNNFSATDKIVANNVQIMWTNFIKFGDPTPKTWNISLFVDNNLSHPADVHAQSSDQNETGIVSVQWNKYTLNDPAMLKIISPLTPMIYPRPFVIPFYERILEILNISVPLTSDPVIG